jgi:Ribonuclease G/E
VLSVKISRRVQERGGCFIKLPNNREGFLLTKRTYTQGEKLTVISKIFNETDKLQRFSDKIKVETEFFIIEDGIIRILFSKNFRNSASKGALKEQLKKQLEDKRLSVSVIVRSAVNSVDELEWGNLFNYAVNCFCSLKKGSDTNKDTFLGLLAKEKAMYLYGKDKSSKIIERPGIFELLGIWDEVEKFQKKKFLFGKNSYLIIEQTAAFCSIDVNTGSDLAIEAWKVNLEACEPIARNLRLRAIGGNIIIDFLPCSKRHQSDIRKKIEISLGLTNSRMIVLGWTRGNNFEIRSPRDKVPLNIIMES